MPLSFSNSPGNWPNRIGKLGLVISQADSYQTSQEANLVNTATGLVAQLTAIPDIQALVGSSYQGVLNSVGGAGSLCQTLAELITNRMVFLDNPRIAQTLDQVNILASILEVIKQMKEAGATVRTHQNIAATAASFTREDGLTPGNGVIVTSVRRPADGYLLQHVFAEKLEAVCIGDSFLDGLTVGNEAFRITGTGRQIDPFAFDWPLGSGADVQLSAVNGDDDNAGGNYLENGAFTAFTVANKPDNWELVIGTAGTHFFKETSITYGGTAALRTTGDGSTLIRFRQKFDDATLGTAGELLPLTQVGDNFFLRRDGTAPGAGVFSFRLTDANGTVVNDAYGNPNTYNVNLTTLTTNYAAYGGAFRLPHVLPASGLYLDIAMPAGNALTNGRSVYLAKGSLTDMIQTVNGGIYLSLHAGSIPFKRGDKAVITVTNDRRVGDTLDTLQTVLFRLLPIVQQRDIIFPYAATAGQETLDDTVFIA